MATESIAKPRTTAALTLVAALWRCASNPVIDIAGANFPAWLVCALVGVSIAAKELQGGETARRSHVEMRSATRRHDDALCRLHASPSARA